MAQPWYLRPQDPAISMTLADLVGLHELSNMLGPLDDKIQKRLLAVLKKPTRRTWNNAFSIILRGDTKMVTLWQAWIAVDPTAPRSARHNDAGNCIWERIPTSEQVFNALSYARSL